jgi:RHH-type transcriptional regulator, proline utilization regulon repressor / proline dehydrogenase / delta 1-pyrroline-5-carboxylate dehydrogenase
MNDTATNFVIERPHRTDALRQAIDQAWLRDESEHVRFLLDQISLNEAQCRTVRDRALDLVSGVRKRHRDAGLMEAFMAEYDLSSEEGIVLMCLAEALLRIPDTETAEKLISDKLSEADWEAHLGKSRSVFVNAGTWGLMLTGRLKSVSDAAQRSIGNTLGRIANKSSEPVVRAAIRQAMRIMGHQYVMGRTIDKALERSRSKENRRFRHSFDMLGEAAMTMADAERYRQGYRDAIPKIAGNERAEDVFSAPSVSVKLSALHPRYEYIKRERLMKELVPVVLELAVLARKHGIALTIDAEEIDRLMVSLDIFAAVLRSKELDGWDGFGIVVQTYQKSAWAVLEWLAELARDSDHRIPVRMVKGAYWDAEIKHGQIEGLDGYPVFTRKVNTDVSFIACASRVLDMRDAFYPQFATHNAHTVAVIAELAGDHTEFEYQRLHGMSQSLYEEVLDSDDLKAHCRVYAPVGNHKDLLPYLVRRLLENGSNTSFVNRIVDEKLPPEEVVDDPIAKVRALTEIPHPHIPQPVDIYGSGRRNSRGLNFCQESVQAELAQAMDQALQRPALARALGAACTAGSRKSEVVSPADTARVVGEVSWADPDQAEQAIAKAMEAQEQWDRRGGAERADILDRIADALEDNHAELMALCTREGGKSLFDGIAEVREAVDFCRYYAEQARKHFAEPQTLPGPTGEHNQLSLHGRGVFVCISPWNFPLAIFTGQIVAALVAGNTVVAKPAEQTPLIATRAVELMHAAGVPEDVLCCLPGDGELGAALTGNPRISGVAFTGSTETARAINRTLAARDGSLATLIAETGGQNAMIVDSSALPEQVVGDAIHSAFYSAGQRCSALRILCLQEDVADHMIEMLAGAMQELRIGDPGILSTDIGPVIDAGQLEMLHAHARRMEEQARLIGRADLDDDLPAGHWFAPCAYEIDSIDQLEQEVFGPILHVVRYRARDIDRLIDQINATGYGLTFGVHSRIDRVQQHLTDRIHAGNRYVNRNMTGAVVGVQPFGGEGLSGTGPKAGGPHYLFRFACERTLTINTSAVGGNASLLTLSD